MAHYDCNIPFVTQRGGDTYEHEDGAFYRVNRRKQNHDGSFTIYLACMACLKSGSKNISRLSMKSPSREIVEGRIFSASGFHSGIPSCIPTEVNKVNRHAMQQLVSYIKSHNVGVKEAYESMVLSLMNPSLVSAEYILSQGHHSFSTLNEIRSTLYRARVVPPEPPNLMSLITIDVFPYQYTRMWSAIPFDQIPPDLPPP